MTMNDLPVPGHGRLARLSPGGINRIEAGAMLRLGTPVMGLALVNMAMSVTDTLMTAAFGPGALAAVAVASDVYSILFYLAVGCIGGMAPLYAAAHGAGDGDRLARLRGAGWAVAICFAVPLAGILWHAPVALTAIGIEPGLVAQGTGYMRAMALTLVPMLAVCVFRTRLTAIERPGAMLRITLAAVPLNAGLNLVLMHGAFGLDGLDVTGAGVASLIVGTGTALALAIQSRRLGDCGLARIRLPDMAEILRIGFPIGIATLAEVGIYLGASVYAATLSASDAAAHSVAIRTAGLTYAVYFGLGQAAMVRTARSGGQPVGQRQTASTALGLGALAGLGLAIVLVLASDGIARLVLGTGDTATVGTAAALLVLLALADLPGPAGAAAGGVLKGMKFTRPVMVFSLVGNWIVAAPVALALTQIVSLGAVGMWIGLALGTIVSSALTILAMRIRLAGPDG